MPPPTHTSMSPRRGAELDRPLQRTWSGWMAEGNRGWERQDRKPPWRTCVGSAALESEALWTWFRGCGDCPDLGPGARRMLRLGLRT